MTQVVFPEDGCPAKETERVCDSACGHVPDAASYMGAPLPTYEVPDEQLVLIGSTARLFCEAFVGKSNL